MQTRLHPVLCAALVAAVGCRSGSEFEGLAPAKDTGGPRVSFDLLQERTQLPFPNDILTRSDPASRTGLRLNASTVAPTQLESEVRGRLDELDGFGTFAPITVSFSAPIDVLDLYARQNDGDPTNDAVYVVDLQTGATTPLDFGGGRFPLELLAPAPALLNDPLASVTNLLFPVGGPDANLLHPLDPGWAASHGGVAQQSDDLLTFYERATNTLILRPVVPLEQQRRYAVVLTNRLHGADGKPVMSPFPGIHHALQREALDALPRLLPQGVKLEDVAFTWAFTTQSVTRDLEALQTGLNGTGPLRDLFLQYPVQQGTSVALGQNAYQSLLKVLQVVDGGGNQNPFLLPSAKLVELLRDPAIGPKLIGPTDPAALDALADSLAYVDYFVAAQFEAPDLLDDSDRGAGDESFQVDPRRGFVRATPVILPFLLAVPRQDPLHGHTSPFPIVVAGHADRSNRFEHLIRFAGTFAQQGLATAAIDAYGHGLAFDAATQAALVQALQAHGAGAFATTLFQTRARDLDNDGTPDPGGDFWTSDVFHTRDVIRQSVVDQLQLIRLLRTFDGTGTMNLGDPNTQSAITPLAGDFNVDNVPDVGGPATWPLTIVVHCPAGPCNDEGSPLKDDAGNTRFPAGAANPGGDFFSFGISLGGILSGILPAVDPSIRAAVPVSGAGGLADVAFRSAAPGVRDATLVGLIGPMLATCNYSQSEGRCGGAGAQPMLVWDVLQVDHEAVLPIAPLALQPGDVVTACDVSQLDGPQRTDAELSAGDLVTGCKRATADAAGNLRLPLPSDGPSLFVTRTAGSNGQPDQVDVAVLRPGDAVRVLVARGGAAPAVIDRWAVRNTFGGVVSEAGTTLRVPARGYGAERNTPELRRLWALSQAVLEPADPVNYAPHWFRNLLPARSGLPANVIAMPTAGDPVVPTSAGIAMARAAGLVELSQPDPTYGLSIDQLLVKAGVVEGTARLQRFADPNAGPRAALGSHVKCDGDCSGDVVLDPSGLSCDANGENCADALGLPRLSPPLRAQVQRPTFAPGGTQAGLSMLLIPAPGRTGQHGFSSPQPQKAFDLDRYLGQLVARYFETRGREIPLDPCLAKPKACPWNAYDPAEP